MTSTTPDQTFRSLLLEMGRERCPSELPHLIVRRLLSDPSVALARVWLIGPGDVCEGCHLRAECEDRSFCLHLVASAGRSHTNPEQQWNNLDGRFRRFPLGVRKVGRIAATAKALEVGDIPANASWLAVPEWAAAEG
ncbi:MAG: hydrogenase, partial [Planctomycetota bacterium]